MSVAGNSDRRRAIAPSTAFFQRRGGAPIIRYNHTNDWDSIVDQCQIDRPLVMDLFSVQSDRPTGLAANDRLQRSPRVETDTGKARGLPVPKIFAN